MSVHNLDALFQPRSVAIVGASTRPRSLGNVVTRNMLAAGFDGPVMPVHPKYQSVGGILCYPRVEDLPLTPDLAVICTPARVVPQVARQLVRAGTRAAVVLTAGLRSEHDEQGVDLETRLLEAARPSGMRILGPNCLGVLAPRAGLNASFAHRAAHVGRIAFVSQSGALCTAVLDWAEARRIGFSCFLSIGNAIDVDFGDVLDYLAGDPDTDAILLYIEAVDEARKFMSAARAAARNKPVIAIKSGRAAEGARAAASHTGALAGADDVYDAALARAGILRVLQVDELFEAVETLARAKPLGGDRLAILTNGGGPGVLATDALIEGGGRLASLADSTIARLDEVLPATWSHANPVDVIGDADGERYSRALEALLDDPGVDATLVLNVPTAVASSEEAARAVIDVCNRRHGNVLTSWLGEVTASASRRLFAEAGIRTYDTPSSAVRAFLHMVRYRRNQDILAEVPPSTPDEFRGDPEGVRRIAAAALAEGRSVLTEPEAKQVLSAYGIPIVATEIARDGAEAGRLAAQIGFPVALKILSPEVSHKSDVGGVALNLESTEEVEAAAEAMARRLAHHRPDATLAGFTVQEMVRRPGAHELIAGVMTDPVFGPVLLAGEGGTAVEVVADKAIGLPPLNLGLARQMLASTRIYRLLQGYRDRPAADIDAICLTLVRLSQLVVDVAEIVELDVNPLYADQEGVIALDARVRVEAAAGDPAARLAIRPYPRELEEEVSLGEDLCVELRPIRPEDEPAHRDFFLRLEPEDIRFRFFGLVREMPHSQLARYTQIDYDREMAFIAARPGPQPETLGVARAVFDPDNTAAEFAIIVRSDMKGRGLGKALLAKLVSYCRSRGVREMVGQTVPENARMLELAQGLGFTLRPAEDSGTVEVRLTL